MRRLTLFAVSALFVMVSLSNHATASARPIDFPDLRKMISLSDPQISPDGTRVVFLKSRSDYSKDRRDTQLMLLQIKSRQMRPLTFERRGVSSPRWSPDGTRIAFLAPVKRNEKSEPQDQIFVLRMDGGEAQPVTDAAEGVDNFAWSPDGRRFAYITQDENPHEKQIEQHLDAFEVGDNDYLHQSEEMPAHLWTIASSGGKARRMTEGSWSLGTFDPTQISDISWSPDGSKIAVTQLPTPLVGDSLGSMVEIVDARTGRAAPLMHDTGANVAFFAPRGDAIAYVRNTNGDYTNGNAVYVTGRGSDPVDVHAKIDRNIDQYLWAPDGKSLWLFGQDGEHNAVWYVSADGTRVRRVELGDIAGAGVGNVAKNGAIAFVGTTPDHPAELYYLASPNAKPQRLTNLNTLPRGIELGRVVPVHWHNDGFAEDGVLTLPPHYDSHRAYPLVLIVHGGPQAASTMGWNSQNQVFAGHGYIVFNPNYRGSTNLGDKYQHAISRDAGAGPGRDVMAGVAAVEKAYKIDRSRIAVTGWSYGGYMTSWLTGHYHVWKAAVAGAALNDWFDDYNVAFYVHTDEPYFGGSPWDPKFAAMWRAQSPITYAQDITTPTLIMGDIGDNNVTITNSFKMYHALKDNGVPVQFVAYPVHGHHPSDPVRSEDVTKRWLSWLDRYLK